MKDYDKAYIACLCWNIWKTRSASVFNASAIDPYKVLQATHVAVQEFWSLKPKDPVLRPTPAVIDTRWLPLAQDIIKINCDGAFSSASGSQPSLSFLFVKRDGNTAADWMVASSLKGVISSGWLLHAPLPLINIMQRDSLAHGEEVQQFVHNQDKEGIG
ncbi:uncharacterized protein LOC129321271 isoform X2 [Prosopis cineraria]|uniref:uncharacterized protein LOC129321271 isoform X2 n=1 Tax=Prosopis cineraria TaxID=364024 RepID=UPI00240F44CC|nr:uncharacterized protein LOC129321271 isoform X2 [Prosopis cineraria]